jgi:parallel beta-helix repeat protein
LGLHSWHCSCADADADADADAEATEEETLIPVQQWLGLATVLLCFLVGNAAEAATYYVSKSGSDSNSCSQAQVQSSPMASINAGVRCLRPGDTLYVRGGTYAEALVSPSMASGTDWTNTVRVAAYPSETVWMKPPSGFPAVVYLTNLAYVEFDGINLDSSNATITMGGFYVNWSSDAVYAHHIRFKNAEVITNRLSGDLQTSSYNVNISVPPSGAGGSNEIQNIKMHGGGGNNSNYGMYIHGSNNLVEGCDIYDVGLAGIQIYNASGTTPTGNTIRNNRIHDITQGYDYRRIGIQVAGSGTLVYNNLLYNITAGSYTSGGQAALSGFSGTGNKFYNNTIINNVAAAIALGSVSSTDVKNNIAYANSVNGVQDFGASGTTVATNLFGVDAQFANLSAADFHLKVGSPAIDAGTGLAEVVVDMGGTPRPQGVRQDIGAYEYSSSQTTTQAPAPPTGVRILSSN